MPQQDPTRILIHPANGGNPSKHSPFHLLEEIDLCLCAAFRPRDVDLIPYVSTREARQLIREALHFDATRLQQFHLSPNARR